MDLKTLIAIPSCIAVVVGGIFAIDARYLHKAEAGEIIQQQQRGYIELKLELTRQRISFLMSKTQRTVDEEEELAFLREQVKLLQEQLAR